MPFDENAPQASLVCVPTEHELLSRLDRLLRCLSRGARGNHVLE